MRRTRLIEVPALRDKRQKTFSLILIFILGLLIIGLASLLMEGFPRTVLTSIGGVVLGFGLTSVIAMIFSPAPFEGVLHMINELLSVPWRSKEEDLVPLRRSFYSYLYTVRDGKGVWLYREFDFGNLELPGYLHALVQYPTDGRAIARYKYYGFPVEKRLLLIGINAALKNEPAVIQILPDCGQSGIYAGLAFLETRSGEHIVAPTIISTEKLVNVTQQGPLATDAARDLDVIWNREFKNRVALPGTTT